MVIRPGTSTCLLVVDGLWNVIYGGPKIVLEFSFAPVFACAFVLGKPRFKALAQELRFGPGNNVSTWRAESPECHSVGYVMV